MIDKRNIDNYNYLIECINFFDCIKLRYSIINLKEDLSINMSISMN
jgi:hypothetical protein